MHWLAVRLTIAVQRFHGSPLVYLSFLHTFQFSAAVEELLTRVRFQSPKTLLQLTVTVSQSA